LKAENAALRMRAETAEASQDPIAPEPDRDRLWRRSALARTNEARNTPDEDQRSSNNYHE